MAPADGSPFLTRKLPTRGLVALDPTYGEVLIRENLTVDELIHLLRAEAVPYIECDRKCLASHLCPFTEPDPSRAGRLREIKCGYQVAVITNFLQCSLPILRPRTPESMRILVDACLAFKEFAFGIFFTSAGVADPVHSKWLGSYYFSVAHSHCRQSIKGAQRFIDRMRPFQGLYLRPTVIFVEGKSEYIVLSTVFERREDLEIRHLGGNARIDFLRAGLLECRRAHVLPGLILDRSPRRTRNAVDTLIREKLILRRHVRFLAGDFEDEFRAEVLERVAVQSIEGDRLRATLLAVADSHGRRQKGFSRCVREKLLAVGVQPRDLDSAVADVKARIAAGIAQLIRDDRYGFEEQLYSMKVAKGRAKGVSRFVHLCRWILGVEGSDVRFRFLGRSVEEEPV